MSFAQRFRSILPVKLKPCAAQVRGQAIVEYILLIAMVAGVVVGFKSVLLPPLLSNLESIAKEAGGKASQGGEARFGAHYQNSKSFPVSP